MAYKHILVPFDGSPLAREALSLGAWLAWRGGGQLDLVRAVPHVHAFFATRPVPGMAKLEAEEDTKDVAQAKTDMSTRAARLRQKGVAATGHAKLGEPTTVLLDHIERSAIDLVVMGTHGRRLTARWLLGSVANELVRQSPVPVLLVPKETKAIHDGDLRMLVALDESPLAEAGLSAALEMSETVPAAITLFEVLEGSAGPDPEDKTMSWYTKPVLGASSYLEDMQENLRRKGINCERAYSMGVAADEIALFAERGNIDVLALGTHGRTGLSRLVLGSVAEQVVRRAPVPVLITSVMSRRSIERDPAVEPAEAVSAASPARVG
jgi:nucleotide-binding universal stress UspA family protein